MNNFKKNVRYLLLKEPPWRNWLARSAVNRKVGGSSPPGGVYFRFFQLYVIYVDFFQPYVVIKNSHIGTYQNIF